MGRVASWHVRGDGSAFVCRPGFAATFRYEPGGLTAAGLPCHASPCLASPCHVRSWYPDRDGEKTLAVPGAVLPLADRVERGHTEAPVAAGALGPPVAQPDALAGELEPLPQPLRSDQVLRREQARLLPSSPRNM